jgi:broad specificity phosphatase PhoE
VLIYLVRHGQTPWNEDGLFRGRYDVPLSDNGIKQAEAAARHLAERDVRYLYTSPLSRAAQTAAIIADHTGCPAIVHEGLIDVHFGAWEGKTAAEVSSNYEDSYRMYKKQPERVVFPGGEPLSRCFERAVKTLHTITDGMRHDAGKTRDGAAAIVSHRVILKLMILGILGLSPAQFWKVQLGTCSITEVIHGRGGFILRKMNDTCHLGEAGSRGADF